MRFYTGAKKPKFYTGAVKDELDSADVPFKGLEAPFDWALGFDIELVLGYRLTCKSESEFYGPRGKTGWGVDRYREIVMTNPTPFRIPVKDQGTSLSCTGQGTAYYVSVLNMIETGKWLEISARDVYAYVKIASGGAYLRDAIKLAVDRGVASEELVSSQPATEANLSTKPVETEKIKAIRKVLQSKENRYIPYMGDRIEQTAKAILQNFGVFFGVYGVNDNSWYSEYPITPDRMVWAHAIYGGKCFFVNGKPFIKFINSWGDDIGAEGWQGIGEDYFTKLLPNGDMASEPAVFNPWTLTDKPNTMTNVKIVKDEDSASVGFFVPANNSSGFIAMARNYGIEIPLTENKSVDWPKVNIQGSVKLTQ